MSSLPFDTLSDITDSDTSVDIPSISSTPSSNISTRLKEYFPTQYQSERTLKRRRKKFKKYEEMMRDPEILRWWKRRYDLFERFDEGIQMDYESWYSVTPEEVARSQAESCKCDVIVDAYAGAGGNSIQFARTCGFVIGIDNNLDRLTNIHIPNSAVYGASSRIDCICGDAASILSALRPSTVDIVFMSPPWGGPSYSHRRPLPPGSSSWNKRRRIERIFSEMQSNVYDDIFDISANIPTLNDALTAAKRLFPLPRLLRIAVYLPRNSALGQVLKMGWGEREENSVDVAIEEYWLRGRRLAICAYIGSFNCEK